MPPLHLKEFRVRSAVNGVLYSARRNGELGLMNAGHDTAPRLVVAFVKVVEVVPSGHGQLIFAPRGRLQGARSRRFRFPSASTFLLHIGGR